MSQGCQCEPCSITPHDSDCAVHNAPALPVGPCDCRAPIALNERDEQGRLIVRDVMTGRQTAALTDAEAAAMFTKKVEGQ